MRLRGLLLIAAAALAAAHVTGELFARPLWRPAELLATGCLLGCAVLSGRRSELWVAAAVLVAGAALTVPPVPGPGTGMQILSPEEYGGLARRVRLDHLVPVVAVLLFLVILLVAVGRRDREHRPGRVLPGAGAAAAVLLAGWVALRLHVIRPADAGEAVAAASLPLLVALVALALGVLTAARRQWWAATGAVLLVLTAGCWIDSALGAVPVPYEFQGSASLGVLGLLAPTVALPQPVQALTAALRLAGVLLVVAGLTRRVSSS